MAAPPASVVAHETFDVRAELPELAAFHDAKRAARGGIGNTTTIIDGSYAIAMHTGQHAAPRRHTIMNFVSTAFHAETDPARYEKPAVQYDVSTETSAEQLRRIMMPDKRLSEEATVIRKIYPHARVSVRFSGYASLYTADGTYDGAICMTGAPEETDPRVIGFITVWFMREDPRIDDEDEGDLDCCWTIEYTIVNCTEAELMTWYKPAQPVYYVFNGSDCTTHA